MRVWQISAGRTHSAAWTCPAPVRRSHGTTSTLQLGTPSSVPAQYTSLHDCSIDDIKARLQLLHYYSDLVYSSWRLLSLVPSHVSVYIICIAIVRQKQISVVDIINGIWPTCLSAPDSHAPFSDRQRLSYDDYLEVRGEIIRTILCCIVYWKLCTVMSTLRWAVLTVLWIGYCLTGPISLCVDSFVFMFVFFVLSCHTADVLYYCNTVGWTW